MLLLQISTFIKHISLHFNTEQTKCGGIRLFNILVQAASIPFSENQPQFPSPRISLNSLVRELASIPLFENQPQFPCLRINRNLSRLCLASLMRRANQEPHSPKYSVELNDFDIQTHLHHLRLLDRPYTLLYVGRLG